MLVAVAQLPASQDKERNRARAADAVTAAAERGAALVVLPEATMAGFGDPDSPLLPLAEPLDGPFVTALQQAAGDAGVTALAGMFEPAGDEQDRVFNTVVAVSADGLLGCYRKLHLFDALGWQESQRVAPGDPTDDVLVLDAGELRIGVLTCYDLRFPEMARVLVDRGATALAVPAAWVAGPGKVEQWQTLLQARAIESTAFVVAADQPGPGFSGHSMIVDPAGPVLQQLDAASAGSIAVADLRAERVDEVRRVLPALGHRRFEVRPRS